MNSELLGHHHYQLVLLLDGWYRFDYSLESMDVECCNRPVQPDQLENQKKVSNLYLIDCVSLQ